MLLNSLWSANFITFLKNFSLSYAKNFITLFFHWIGISQWFSCLNLYKFLLSLFNHLQYENEQLFPFSLQFLFNSEGFLLFFLFSCVECGKEFNLILSLLGSRASNVMNVEQKREVKGKVKELPWKFLQATLTTSFEITISELYFSKKRKCCE
jgi:hypothetical protein